MDCYTSWCGPCKALAKNVFTQEKVGEFFNPRFINVKYDMEKGDGKMLNEKYKKYIVGYPTLLLLNADTCSNDNSRTSIPLSKFMFEVKHFWFTYMISGCSSKFLSKKNKGLNENTFSVFRSDKLYILLMYTFVIE